MKLHAVDFIRRFCLHIVPRRFVRIRYFGILSHRNKKKMLLDCRAFYEITTVYEKKEISWADMFLRVTGVDPYKCPKCKTGTFVCELSARIPRFRAPPDRVPECVR